MKTSTRSVLKVLNDFKCLRITINTVLTYNKANFDPVWSISSCKRPPKLHILVDRLFLTIIISHSNWIEKSTIQGVITQIISKSDEREARGRFDNTSAITP